MYQNRHLYRVDPFRGAQYAMWLDGEQAFLVPADNFGRRYLDRQLPFEADDKFGTVLALDCLGEVPAFLDTEEQVCAYLWALTIDNRPEAV